MSRVLVVEDETHLAKGLRFNLEAEGHAVEVCGDGETAVERLLVDRELFDAVVLDVMLPGKDGFAVATALRKAKNYVPVLMLTARGRPEDVLQGFAAGADDYLPKPFQLPIFLARLQGLLRRNEWLRRDKLETKNRAAIETAGKAPRLAANGVSKANRAAVPEDDTANAEADVVTFDGKTIDFNNLELHANDTTVQLTLMEAKLLRHLIRNKGNSVSRKSILEDVWGLHEDTDTRAIDNFIVRLRRYIEKDPSKPRHLTTVRGVGYRFIA
jgi:DNA-binding response OmpR family regulator